MTFSISKYQFRVRLWQEPLRSSVLLRSLSDRNVDTLWRLLRICRCWLHWLRLRWRVPRRHLSVLCRLYVLLLLLWRRSRWHLLSIDADATASRHTLSLYRVRRVQLGVVGSHLPDDLRTYRVSIPVVICRYDRRVVGLTSKN